MLGQQERKNGGCFIRMPSLSRPPKLDFQSSCKAKWGRCLAGVEEVEVAKVTYDSEVPAPQMVVPPPFLPLSLSLPFPFRRPVFYFPRACGRNAVVP